MTSPLVTALTCFKKYDIRGKVNTEITPDIAYRIGRAFAATVKPKTTAVGGDARLSSPALKQALTKGLMDAGVNVLDIGLSGTEEIYFTVFHYQLDSGIQITASHNPIDYNGMKLVGKHAVPIGPDNGLLKIKAMAETQQYPPCHPNKGHYHTLDIMPDYIAYLLKSIKLKKINPLKLVVNSGNGPAAKIIDGIEAQFIQRKVPVTFIKVQHDINGKFPNGVPNPLLPTNHHWTQHAVIQHNADLGIAWDGDFDRCFFFDKKGHFIESYYIVGLLTEYLLQQSPDSNIIHDPRGVWYIQAMCHQNQGKAIQHQTGHVFIKQKMQQIKALYGGEISGHHYFRDFGYCDSGMLPWLFMIELISIKSIPVDNMLSTLKTQFPISGEINLSVKKPHSVINKIYLHYQHTANKIEQIDGLSMIFFNEKNPWRFNLRQSNTESLLRLNIESKGNKQLVDKKTDEIIALITHFNIQA